MIEKALLNKLLQNVKKGALNVKYWDGTTQHYGKGKAYFTLDIKSRRAIRRMMRNLNLGFGEAYMNQELDIIGPLDHIVKLASENATPGRKVYRNFTYRPKRNTKATQKSYIHHHYDLGNDFYKLWLDKSMTYSCAYFKTPNDKLEDAQTQKIDHITSKLQLKKGQTLLDIGCGWGNLLFSAAKKYGVTGTGITLSEEQFKHCTAEAKHQKLDKQLTFKLMNYQDLAEQGQQFDRVVSVGMFEHVGRHNQSTYFKLVNSLLKDGGISVLHTISQPVDLPNGAWVDKYIFPGGHLPTIESVIEQLHPNNFRLIDYESLKLHYALTLDEWWRRFENNKDKVITMYDERFYRMWRLWLANSSAGFRYGDLDVSQFILVKTGRPVEDIPLTRSYII